MGLLDHINLTDVLVFDIETVPMARSFSELDSPFKELWEERALRYMDPESDETIEENFFNNAGVRAEFAKVICISAGYFSKNSTGQLGFRIKSFASATEKEVLTGFAQLLNEHFPNFEKHKLCGHNLKEFDVPFLSRRMLVKEVALPALLNLAGAKPWHVPHLDTMELWKFGDRKSYTSLKLLAALLNVPTPKDDIDGSDVAKVFWVDGDLDRIRKYCQKDVLAVAQILLKFKSMPLISEDDVTFVDEE